MRSKVDSHIHTKYSGGTNHISFIPDSIAEPRKVIKYAEKNGMDLIAITDHNTLEGAFLTKKYAPSKVIVGEEITTSDGEVLGLFLNEEIPRDLSGEETVERIHEQGGLAIAPHPYSIICPSLGKKIMTLDFDGIETLNALHRDGILNRKAHETNKILKKAALAGSDAHTERMIGNCYTMFEGKTKEEFYTAVKNKATSVEGKLTPLTQLLGCSWNIALHLTKQSLGGLYRRTRIARNMGLFLGSCIYLFPLTSILASYLGNYYYEREVKKKYPPEEILMAEE